MRWRKSVSARERHSRWHLWFAWYPASVNGCRVWLEPVMRRGEYIFTSQGWIPEWEYQEAPQRTKGDDRDLHRQIYYAWRVFPRAMLHTAVLFFLVGMAVTAGIALLARAEVQHDAG